MSELGFLSVNSNNKVIFFFKDHDGHFSVFNSRISLLQSMLVQLSQETEALSYRLPTCNGWSCSKWVYKTS